VGKIERKFRIYLQIFKTNLYWLHASNEYNTKRISIMDVLLWKIYPRLVLLSFTS
jgi:Uma2 family endonuclease